MVRKHLQIPRVRARHSAGELAACSFFGQILTEDNLLATAVRVESGFTYVDEDICAHRESHPKQRPVRELLPQP